MKHPPQSDIFGGGIDPSIRSWPTAVKRGLRQKCPACGTGKILYSYTKVKDTCASCGLALAGHQADDMPPYVTMLISGHIIIPLALYFERSLDPPMGLQFLIWGPALLGLTFWLLPRVKGAIIGLQWAHRMHGFSDSPAEDLEQSLK
ncbi:MAG: DUF983 domain-containing protein [Parvularculaceae bacterium]